MTSAAAPAPPELPQRALEGVRLSVGAVVEDRPDSGLDLVGAGIGRERDLEAELGDALRDRALVATEPGDAHQRNTVAERRERRPMPGVDDRRRWEGTGRAGGRTRAAT
jgi:hypothetical protein